MTRPAAPPAWRWLLLIAAVQVVLHLVTNGRFGIFRDEYYYLACARRLDWGYVDQPAFSIWTLRAWVSVFGDSVHSIRVLPALCGGGLVLLGGMTAAQMGGRVWAQILAALSVCFLMVGLVVTGFYSMNAFDFVAWMGAYYYLVRIVRTGDGRDWIAFGCVVGLGLFNKIGLLVLGLALVVGLLLTEHRRHFRDRRLYLGGAIALAFLVPYLLWNATHGWATREFVANAQAGKISAFTPWEFLKEIVLEANPATLLVWAGGLLWLLLAPSARRFRMVGLMVVTTFVVLNLQRSKPYYFASSLPVLMAAGGVAWEGWLEGRRWVWLRVLMPVTLVASSVAVLPLALPLLSPRDTVDYLTRIGLMPAPQEVGHTSALPQYFSDRLGWENLARVVSEEYLALPADERARSAVFGQNYGHAGALEYWAKEYPLPPVYSDHNNYWFWGPPPADLDVWLVIDGDVEDLRGLFEEATEVAVARTPEAQEPTLNLVLCRGLKRPLAEIWDADRNFN